MNWRKNMILLLRISCDKIFFFQGVISNLELLSLFHELKKSKQNQNQNLSRKKHTLQILRLKKNLLLMNIVFLQKLKVNMLIRSDSINLNGENRIPEFGEIVRGMLLLIKMLTGEEMLTDGWQMQLQNDIKLDKIQSFEL